MDSALETDVPKKVTPLGLVVPKGWRECHVEGATCFYWTCKSGCDGNCLICNKNFPAVNLAKLKKPATVGGKTGWYVCGGKCWGEYTQS